MNNKMREDFETWQEPWDISLDTSDMCWEAWQAAQASASATKDAWIKPQDDALRYVRRVLEAGRDMTDQDQAAAIEIVHGLRGAARGEYAGVTAPVVRRLNREEIGDMLNSENRYSTEMHDFAKCVMDAMLTTKAKTDVPEGWQPIETAPKDEPILVGPAKRMGICVAMHDSRDGWVTETCSEWVSIYTPTHWVPLPKPPEPAK